MILADTCVIIDYLSEKPDVKKIINDIGIENTVLNSIIVMELISGSRDKIELNSIKKKIEQISNY